MKEFKAKLKPFSKDFEHEYPYMHDKMLKYFNTEVTVTNDAEDSCVLIAEDKGRFIYLFIYGIGLKKTKNNKKFERIWAYVRQHRKVQSFPLSMQIILCTWPKTLNLNIVRSSIGRAAGRPVVLSDEIICVGSNPTGQ